MLSVQAKEALRVRVARAVVEEGMRPGDAARTFHVSRTSVWKWANAYRRGRRRALAPKPMGRPKRSRLAGHQAATVVRLILDRCPDQLKLPFALWTREAVCGLIARRCGLEVSVWTAGRYLKAWNLTPQKPLRRAYERDPQAVKAWLEREYPGILARARREKGQIHWGDEMGLRSDHQSGTSYGRRGRTPAVPGTGRRFGCNLISTVTNLGVLRFMVFKSRFTTPVFLRFLRRLLASTAGHKCFLVVDSHPVHKAAAVRRWVEQRADRIELFHLPGYSPELNPDEYLNQDVKSNALGRTRPRDQRQMLRQLRTYLRATQARPDVVRNYFHAQPVRYAAADHTFITSCSR